MTTMKRRDFLNAAAVAAGGAMFTASPAWAQQGETPPTPKRGWPSRPGKVEILFKAPGLSGNGMQCTEEGIWTIDVAGSRTDTPGRCKVYLSSYEGKMLRELSPEGTGPSGIGVDEDNRTIWIGSTYSREIIRADAKTGETIEKHFTPGAGVIYKRVTDTPPRPDTYAASVRGPRGTGGAGRGRQTGEGDQGGGGNGGRRGTGDAAAPAPGQNSGQRTADGLGVGRGGAVAGNPGPPAPGTGAHGQQTQNGKLWIAVPPGRMIYRMDPKTWTVEHMFPTVGFRPHGIGIETPDAKFLWESDTNMGAFFKRDTSTGEVVDSIVLPEGSPFPHGASVWKGYIYWVDDIGGGIAPVCRTKI
jgi:sugar lactone lactonase YvrE